MQSSTARTEIVADIVTRTGIDEAMIVRLVPAIHAKIADRSDTWAVYSLPGSRTGIGISSAMYAFWSSVAPMSGRYMAEPMEKHMSLLWTRSTSTNGSGCSRPRLSRSAHRPPRRISSSALAGSRRASSWVWRPRGVSLVAASAYRRQTAATTMERLMQERRTLPKPTRALAEKRRELAPDAGGDFRQFSKAVSRTAHVTQDQAVDRRLPLRTSPTAPIASTATPRPRPQRVPRPRR